MLKLFCLSKVNAVARSHTRDLRVLWALEELQLVGGSTRGMWGGLRCGQWSAQRRAAAAFAGFALAACSQGAVRRAASTAPPPPHPPPAASNAASATPLATAELAVARECRIDGPTAGEPLRFDWEKTVARGPAGAIHALAASAHGVLVVGAESRGRAQSEPFVAAFDADGRERYRVTLAQPRSTTAPPRASAVAVAAVPSGEAYVVSTAARADDSGAVVLSLVDARGRLVFSTPVELSALTPPSLVVEPNGDVIVAGSLPSGQELVVFKQSQAGNRVWTRSYQVSGGELRLVRMGQRLLLVGSLGGTAQWGATRLARLEKVEFSCAGDPYVCQERALSLLIAELDPTGEPLGARLLGPPTSRLSVSDVAVLGDRLLVTGEYEGPPVELGKVALCELESGMPELAPQTFHELGGAPHCACRRDRRDLFLLAIDAELEPRWARTLALGAPTPRVLGSAGGQLRWAAEGSRAAVASGSTAAVSSEVSLWSLDAAGNVSARRVAGGGLWQMSAALGAVYLSDQRVLRKSKW